MGAEGIVVGDAAPMDIDAGRTPLAGTDAVAPVTEIGEAAARPADHRHLQLLQGVDHIGAVAPDIGNLAVGPDPDTFIDAAAQMFGEMAIDLSRNGKRRDAKDRP